MSPHRPSLASHEHSATKKSIQQRQIEDLEQKVDLILEHNDKLVIENTELKKRLAQNDTLGNSLVQKDRLSMHRFAEESEYAVRKLNSELMIKGRELEHTLAEFEAFRDVTRKESDSMR